MSLALLEPLIPESQPLREQAAGLFSSAAGLGRHLHPLTLQAVAELLRTVNCYYSNLIEGHNTHPIQIERAMRQEYAQDARLRDLQLEAAAHIDVQRLAEKRLQEEPDVNVCSPAFICWLHYEFYIRMPDRLRIVRDLDGDREILVEPGAIRTYDVRVGDGCAGLWTVARGLARRRDEYKQRLAAADAGRWDAYDGRGARSNRALVEFCEFFLAVCEDQLQYMGGLLEIDGLAERVRGYCKAREAGAVTDPTDLLGGEKFTPGMTRLLIGLVYRGELPRAEVPDVARAPARTARRFAQRLLDEGFVTAETHRAPIRLRIPAHAAPFVFPGLYTVA